MTRLTTFAVLVTSGVVAATQVAGCLPDPAKNQTFPTVGSESRFLSVCAVDADCVSPASCICGACTLPCGSDALCSYLDVSARCLYVDATCAGGMTSSRACDVACGDGEGDCGEGETCVDGRCRAPATGPLGTPPEPDPGALPVVVIPCTGPDGDGDGWPDACDPCPAADTASCPVSVSDHDGDGVTDDLDDDDDGDGLLDVDEAAEGTAPDDADSDDDGLSDGFEASTLGTDPTNADSDFDGLQDGTEFGNTEPLRDTRLEAFVPDAHPTTVTNPRNPDTDGDGAKDGEEDKNHNGHVDPGEGDPLDPTDGLRDTDGDGLIDRDEQFVWHTDHLQPDTDRDQLDDKLEVMVWFTDPNVWDTDGDGDSDGVEVRCGSDPLDSDSDHTSVACDAPQCATACDCYALKGFAFPDTCGARVAGWRCVHGACAATCSDSACSGCSVCTDPDQDGVSSFVEEICGTDPGDPQSMPADGVQDADHDGIPACRDGDDGGASVP